jgi:hypothetical protein
MQNWVYMKQNINTGIYASCSYTANTILELDSWIKEHSDIIPAPIPLDQAHTTILFCDKHFNVPSKSVEEFEGTLSELSFTPTGFALLGDSADEKALVILLQADSLVDLHEHLISHGASHSFDEYIPHITVSYQVPPHFDTASVTLPNFKFEPEKIHVGPLNTNRRTALEK